MSDDAEDTRHQQKSAAVGALVTMLDYAMLEGAELRLPFFVLLLRLARLELMDNIDNGSRVMTSAATKGGSTDSGLVERRSLLRTAFSEVQR